eukprot:gnl/TRDRNA2_/TRDRNA2_187738_c0_seq1.p1 gnl/TRDRNA2_/TRDRNA2_187738_c0~~gnl/TRDRNA2_/TRDRNA2_187738_c0_seq1.p1  ORF type:complete len:307 (-),score=49.67 gnl/TRDRNA2_/TRDRNA2_187738_c0_seq1:369-1232(-)
MGDCSSRQSRGRGGGGGLCTSRGTEAADTDEPNERPDPLDGEWEIVNGQNAEKNDGSSIPRFTPRQPPENDANGFWAFGIGTRKKQTVARPSPGSPERFPRDKNGTFDVNEKAKRVKPQAPQADAVRKPILSPEVKARAIAAAAKARDNIQRKLPADSKQAFLVEEACILASIFFFMISLLPMNMGRPVTGFAIAALSTSILGVGHFVLTPGMLVRPGKGNTVEEKKIALKQHVAKRHARRLLRLTARHAEHMERKMLLSEGGLVESQRKAEDVRRVLTPRKQKKGK